MRRPTRQCQATGGAAQPAAGEAQRVTTGDDRRRQFSFQNPTTAILLDITRRSARQHTESLLSSDQPAHELKKAFARSIP